MTVSYIKSGVGRANYYTNCMTPEGRGVDDYYTGSAKEPPGTWYVGPSSSGSRISSLGIKDGIKFAGAHDESSMGDVEKFHRLINGRHGENDSPLVQNVDSENRVAMHDWTLSAPKSVSVVWSQAKDSLKDEIEKAQLESSRVFLDFMSSKSQIRQKGKDGIIKLNAPLRGALFSHASSRENDPQLHTHSVIFNMGEGNGKVNALETKEMMKWTGAAASLYHAELAWRVKELGFAVEVENKIFEITGVPKEVTQHFSKRREQIVAAVKKRQEELGMEVNIDKASRGLQAMATIETRDQKNELTREQLSKLWHDEGRSIGFTSAEVSALLNAELAINLTQNEINEKALEAVNELVETDAVFTEPSLLTAVAVKLQGFASVEQIHASVERLKNEILVKNVREDGQDLYSTKAFVVLEKEMIELAKRYDSDHVLVDFSLLESLDPEQREAALAACTDANSVTIIEGSAGAGKTFTMAATARVYESKGYQVTGLATSWAAALNLKDSAKLADGRAITGWLNDIEKGKLELNEKSLLIVDEAGMLGSRTMRDVLREARHAGAKVILLGDTLQQKSPAAGDPLRCLAGEIKSHRIDIIRRQADEKERQAVHDFFSGNAKDGFAPYREKKSVHISQTGEILNQEIISRWSQSREKDAEKTNLMLAVDRKSVADLNRLAHEHLKASGQVESGLYVQTLDSADESDLFEFSVGDEVVLRKNDRSQEVYNRTQGRIEGIDGRILHIKTNAGLIEFDVDSKKWAHPDGGVALSHAYAATIHSAQGLTVAHSFVKDSSAMGRASAGVAMSRHVDSCEVFIDAQVRHEKAMSRIAADHWVPLREFSNEAVLKEVESGWSRLLNKDSTLDYDLWRDARGLPINFGAEAEINELQAAATAQVEIQRIREESKGFTPRELPFMKSPGFALPMPASSREQMIKGIEGLQKDQIHDDIIERALHNGELNFESGQPIFLAKNSQNEVVRHFKDGAEEPSRARQFFLPILSGDPGRIAVFKTGREGLHYQSLQVRQGEIPSTIIVSGGDESFLKMPAIAEKLEKADAISRFDSETPAVGNVIEANQKFAAEQKARAAEEEKKDFHQGLQR